MRTIYGHMWTTVDSSSYAARADKKGGVSAEKIMTKLLLNAQDAVIPTYFQRVLVRILTNQGFSKASLFDGLNVKENHFNDDACRLTFEQHSQFIKNVLAVTGDPHFGWRFGQHINVTALGMLGYAIMASENGIAAVDTLTKFFRLRAPSYQLTLPEMNASSSAVIVQIDESFDFGEVRYFMLSCMVSAFEHVFSFLIQQPGLIERVEFACAQPAQWENISIGIAYAVVFDVPSTKIHLNAELLSRRLPTADPDTEKTTSEICLHMLQRVEHPSGIVREVEQLIINNINSCPSLTDAATYLCVSPRTLRRALQKSNTSYQKLLDNARFTIAKELLLNTTKTTSDIGFDLGFKDASNFNRAFKTWAGSSPGQYRKSQQ